MNTVTLSRPADIRCNNWGSNASGFDLAESTVRWLQNLLDNTPREKPNKVSTGMTLLPRGAMIIVDDRPALERHQFLDLWTPNIGFGSSVVNEEYINVLATATSTAADLRWLKESLQIGVSGLADLFGVTRKTVYDWLEGIEPKRGRRGEKIASLRKVLEESTLGSKIQFLDQVWDQSSESGTTLFELIQSDDLTVDLNGELRKVLEELKPALALCEESNKKGTGNDFGRAHIEDLGRSI